MKNKFKLLILAITINASVFSQVKVYQNGHLNIGNVVDYGQLSLKSNNSGTIWSESNNTSNWGNNIAVDVKGNTAGLRANTLCYVVYNNNAVNFYVTGDGYGFSRGNYVFSDRSLKENIVNIEESCLEKVLKLQGVKYNYKDNELKKVSYGLIAQEVEEIFPEIVQTSYKGIKGVEYNALIPILIESIKIQQNELNKLKQQVNSQNINNSISEEKYLMQNKPNPFNRSTIIELFIPETIKMSQLMITDLTGKSIKSYSIMERNSCKVEITNDDLYEGVFLYSLILDGAIVETKKMTYIKP